jgi:alcohol dehydrogenase
MPLTQKLDTLQAGDIPAIASQALKEAHYNYPVPKYMDRAQCELILKQMLA